jgi:hypothetical protein
MSWDDNWVRVFVTIGAAALGAIFAGVVNAYAARLKVKEIELNYLYKLRDGYLDNARKMTGEVYVPISVALTNLFKGYERFTADLATSKYSRGGSPRISKVLPRLSQNNR